ncbi:unnamed protein product [Mytilus edulis]|uniref:Uncharacterized protein n=1 Tax=Mytilus edulis TaxID=6550 RepID=A0A8S3RKX5_MYTED|nr:unnamed protein product [Mytilus edulis]
MNPDALTEILFWDSSLRKLNEQGVDICRVDHDFVSDFDIFCDASDVGFGGYLSTQCSVVTCVDNSEMSGNWTSDEKLESSTWRELECARRVLCTYESKFSLDNKSVSINSDNKNVPHILSSVNLRRNVEAALVESGVSENCNIYNLAGKMTTFLVDSRSENTCKKDPVLPLDNILQPRRKYNGEEYHKIALQQQHKSFMLVHKTMKKSKQKQAKYANKNSKDIKFEVGNPVFYKKHRRASKLSKKWTPYYRIIEQTSPVSLI